MKMIKSQIVNMLLKDKRVEEEALLKAVPISPKLLQKHIGEINDYVVSNDLGEVIKTNGCYSLSLNGFGAAYKVIRKSSYNRHDKDIRLYSIIAILLDSTDYITIQDLADELYLSTRQISYELVKVREILQKHNLFLKSVPHHGLIIEGSELNKRVCYSEVFSRLFQIDENENDSKNRIKVIRGLLFDILQKNNYHITDYSFENLVIHLYIAVLRVETDFNMNDIEPYFASDKSTEDIGKEIVCEIEKAFSVKFSDNEYKYVVLHLQAKQNIADDYYNQIPYEVYDLVNEFLRMIDENYNTDLRLDFKLCMVLALHFVPLISRVKYGFGLKNPLLAKIKSDFIYEYELAEYGCNMLSKKLNVDISDDEIGYIAIDIKMSLDKRFSREKCNVLLICSTGRGTAELLRSDLMSYFGSHIARMDLSSYFNAERMNLDEYDYIFSTVPVLFKTNATVIQIAQFIDESEIAKINRLFINNYNDSMDDEYFPECLFMGKCNFEDKYDALKKMSEHISKFKKVPEDFLECVLEREKLAVTSFGNGTAMPHPYKLITDETFVCVAIADKPISWNGNKEIQLIAMISVENAKNKNLKYFFNSLSKIIKNRNNVEKLIKDPTYKTLYKIIHSETE